MPVLDDELAVAPASASRNAADACCSPATSRAGCGGSGSWIAFIVFLIALLLGYGSGYGGWGPPYPRYYRDRQGRRFRVEEVPEPEPPAAHRGWGRFADVVWLLILAAIIWFIVWIWVY